MKIFITDEQKAELEHLHDTTRDGRVRDRIKAVLLASEGWTSAPARNDGKPNPSEYTGLSDIGSTVIHDDKTINDYNTARFFIEMRKHHPNYRQKIHMILYASYHRTQLIKGCAFVVSAIERLWKVMNGHVWNNQIFKNIRDIRNAIFNFPKPRCQKSQTH
ncbi:hypothetical protein BVY05_00860 [Pectobacterium odoriferum]|nr:hypothetical protein BVY05_00860 [Pectobacterium odoriferum]